MANEVHKTESGETQKPSSPPEKQTSADSPHYRPPQPVKPKPLPSFSSVLRPSSKYGPRFIKMQKPLAKPTLSSKDAEEEGRSGNKEKPSYSSPFHVSGKFADSASTADTTETDSQLGQFSESSASSAFGSRAVYSKPKFKQVVRQDRRRNGTPFSDSKTELEKLMDQEYTGSEADDLDPKELAKPHLDVPGLVPMLLPHQSFGVRFMSSRENARKYARGGLLADDMGLGKTIQSIALILNRRPKPEASTKATLVVAPLAVMDQWRDEIRSMAPDLSVMTHQGQRRTEDAEVLHKYDVVVTTYDVVSSEYKKGGALHSRPWYRVIADEAHTFRNRETGIAKAMLALESDGRRWALTGTPIHNNIMDLYTLFAFIQVPVYNNLNKFTEISDKKNIHVMQRQLKIVMLRRTQRVLSGVLPEIHKFRQDVELSPAERQKYYHAANEMRKSKSFVMVTRMRQACDGLLTNSMIGQSNPPSETPSPAPSSTSSMTSLSSAGSSSRDRMRTPDVGEVEEDDLLANMLNKLSIAKDPSGKKNGEDKFLNDDNSKVQAIRKILTENRTRQTVVFSSFVTMLFALKPMLDHEGIQYEIYYGQLNAKERSTILSKFRDPKAGVTVLLCSLQTAAVGLNLTSASQVIMTEPWWNPQIVDQAIKRVHRLGQKNEVRCIELYAKNLMEERMLSLQDKKRELAKRLLDGSDQLSEDDKKFLWFGDEDPDTQKENVRAVPKEDIKKDTRSPGKINAKRETKTNTEVGSENNIKSDTKADTKDPHNIAKSHTKDSVLNSNDNKHSKDAKDAKDTRSVKDAKDATEIKLEEPMSPNTRALKELKLKELPKMRKHTRFTE